jgi:hypothetical protein
MLDDDWANADGLHVVRNSDLSVLHDIPSGMDLGLSTSQYPPSPAYTPFETFDYESTSSYMITNGDNSAAYEPLFPMFGSLVPVNNTDFTSTISETRDVTVVGGSTLMSGDLLSPGLTHMSRSARMSQYPSPHASPFGAYEPLPDVKPSIGGRRSSEGDVAGLGFDGTEMDDDLVVDGLQPMQKQSTTTYARKDTSKKRKTVNVNSASPLVSAYTEYRS